MVYFILSNVFDKYYNKNFQKQSLTLTSFLIFCDFIIKINQDSETPLVTSNSMTNKHSDLTRPKLTVLDASWNIANAIQGMFVLSLPWAISHGGFLGLFLIIITAVACAYTGRILVDCLYETTIKGERRRVYHSYQELAEVCIGPKMGPRIVNIAQALELLMISHLG